jgi:hypothetical protein
LNERIPATPSLNAFLDGDSQSTIERSNGEQSTESGVAGEQPRVYCLHCGKHLDDHFLISPGNHRCPCKCLRAHFYQGRPLDPPPPTLHEPWRVVDGDVLNAAGELVLDSLGMAVHPGQDAEIDAIIALENLYMRRIVACVNACEGLGTEQLQALALKTGKSIEHVAQGIAIDDDINVFSDAKQTKKIGAQLLVCVAKGCKVHKKEWEKPAAKRGPASSYNPEAERAKREAGEVAAKAENKIRLDLAKQAIAKVKTIPPDALRILALRAVGHGSEFLDAIVPRAKITVKAMAVTGPDFAKAVAGVVLSASGATVGSWDKPDHGRGEFLEALKLFGVDGSDAWNQAKAETKKATAAVAKAKPAKKAAKKKAAKR